MLTNSYSRHTYSDKVRERLQKAGLSDLLGFWYPYASQTALEALTSFVAWMFVVDDAIDSYRQHSPDQLTRLRAECLDYVQRSLGLSNMGQGASSPPPTYTEASVMAFSEIGRALSSACTENQRHRVAREAKITMDGYSQEISHQIIGHIPTVAEYLTYRTGSSCMLLVTSLIEFANGLQLPDEIMESVEVRELYQATAKVQWVTNDLVSVNKEIQHGFVENMVVLLADGDAQAGVDRTVRVLEEAKARFEEASSVILHRHGSGQFGNDIHLIVKNCMAMCSGNIRWR